MMQRHHITGGLFLLVACALCVIVALEFLQMRRPELIVPNARLSKRASLSDYLPSLRGSNGDTEIYFFEGDSPGGTVLVLGGTHPNEPAGFVTAVVLVENAHVSAGRLIVIPQACKSGFTCTDPLEGYPQEFSFLTRSGPRRFRFGSRGGNPLDQWPDPLVYLQYPSQQQLSGNETRNLNRAYPGRAEGSFTERVGYAIVQVIVREGVDVAIDLHEAAPEVPIINALITHEKGRELAAAAVLELEFEGLKYSLELSPTNFHGLSHREWGDYTNVLPFLMETSNPSQGRLRGTTSANLVVSGKDEEYVRAMQNRRVRITYDPAGEPMSRRVGRHVMGLRALLQAFSERYPDRSIAIEGLPTYDELMERGVGAFLQ
jgi:hypothetical protein